MRDVFDPQPPTTTLLASICRCAGGVNGAEHGRRAAEQAASSARASAEEAQRRADQQAREANQRFNELRAQSPDPDRFQVESVDQCGAAGQHLVLQVRYTSCVKCEYEGLKTLVFLNTKVTDALKWRRIDPHFRAGKSKPYEAPSPDARFPGSTAGYANALAFANMSHHSVK